MIILEDKIAKSKQIIQSVNNKWPSKKVAIAWTGGKDSTVLLHLVSSLFNGAVPFPILFNDSTIEFPEIYTFIRKLQKDWGLKLLWIKHDVSDIRKYNTSKIREEKMEIMRVAKIHAIAHALKKYKFEAIMSGIRWDEHPARSKETHVSPRKDHVRIHPCYIRHVA